MGCLSFTEAGRLGGGGISGKGNGWNECLGGLQAAVAVRRAAEEGEGKSLAGLVLKSPVGYGKEFKLSPGGNVEQLKKLGRNVP